MKSRLSFSSAIIFILFASTLVFAQDTQVPSQITQVTVFPDSALVTRTAEVKLGAGEERIELADIIPDIDENSLRVEVSDNEAVKIMGATVKKEFLTEAPSEKVKELTQAIQDTSDEMARVQNQKIVLAEEKNFLDSVRLFGHDQLPKDLVTKMPTGKDLTDTLTFLDAGLTQNYQRVLEADLKLRELQKKMQVLQNELGQISGSLRKVKCSILVELDAKKGVSCELKVSFLVRQAWWKPLYDARADFEKGQVELAAYGLVRQKTGEDWSEVAVTLSTARPAVGGNMPYVAPWVLRPYQPPVPSSREVARKPASVFALQKMAFDESAIGGMEEAGTLAAPREEPVTKVEEKGIAVSYALPKKADIKSDGSEHKLPIISQTLQADFKYSAYPRSVLLAYLGSRVKNAPQLQLLGGRVNIFLQGDFVGASSIETIGPGEEFDLYLGADENVKVKRELIEKKVDQTLIGSIASPNKTTVFKYKLTVENYKSKKADIKLFEAMPVSEDDRIKVRIDKLSLEPTQKDWKDRKGIWLWDFSLEPKQKKEIFYTYTIEHPRQMIVEGLGAGY